MEIYQERKLSMCVVVLGFMDGADPAIIALMPKLDLAIAELGVNIADLQATREKQELKLTGIAVKKMALRTSVIAVAVAIGRNAKAFAVNEGNAVLASEVGYTKSVLELSADTILRDRCQVIHDRVSVFVGDLGDYGISADSLVGLQNAITLYKAAIPTTREGISDKKTATEKLEMLFGKTDLVLERMDVLVEMVRASHVGFYRSFRNRRILTDSGYRKLAVRGHVRDSEGLALGNVVVRIEGVKKVFRTSAKGNFQIRVLEEGDYTFVFSRFGFMEERVLVSVNNGERSEVVAVLREL